MKIIYNIKLYLNLIKYSIRQKFIKYNEDKYTSFLINYYKNKDSGFYIDVGSYHPIRLSNTNFLYKKGWNGINIDISKKSIDLFNIARKRDVNLNIGAGNKNQISTGYFQKDLFFANTLNYKHSKKILNNVIKKKIKIFTLDTVIKKYAKNKKINFLDIDCEGNDFNVLKGLNLKENKIELISIEMHNYNNKLRQQGLHILQIMKKNNYKKIFGKYPGTLIFKKINS